MNSSILKYILLTSPRALSLGSKSLLVGDDPNTYSTIFTPSPPSERGERIDAASDPGKLPALLLDIEMGCETAWSETINSNREHKAVNQQTHFSRTR